MTAPFASGARTTLAAKVAATVESVPGVAFLRPGLADRLRSALSSSAPDTGRPAPDTGSAPPAGVRMTRPEADGPWHVEIHVVVLRQARTVEVARAVRDGVERHLDSLQPAHPTPVVTVTVTGMV
ncbi:hypothetical protein F3K40_39685 [Streptomyces sp. LBUM 1478]|uniref:hypothetical protein n=1 Tax=Streptomyces scabiei TaxID=1930 RepID=UPI0007659BAC|nr:hypothetical protein [Streptomyces scabiei]MBP5910305.1 hypothetical protein [Streptomyces sp. LBUM 1478]MBP5934508.1 hypothetical protein [Streptomyces sp. LBUM 1479]MDX2536197.1 hypothetical protein [Streptomyces scabiei]MDX2797336.1 hypothetical protein [Streptomyces scabiei]MDX2856975.1 hypothetical protein [Streptomyces scabiei]